VRGFNLHHPLMSLLVRSECSQTRAVNIIAAKTFGLVTISLSFLRSLATPVSRDSGTPSGFFGPYDAYWVTCLESLSPRDFRHATTSNQPSLPHPVCGISRRCLRNVLDMVHLSTILRSNRPWVPPFRGFSPSLPPVPLGTSRPPCRSSPCGDSTSRI